MKRALRIVAITAGVVCLIAALILGGIYLENIIEFYSGLKKKFVDFFTRKDDLEEDIIEF